MSDVGDGVYRFLPAAARTGRLRRQYYSIVRDSLVVSDGATTIADTMDLKGFFNSGPEVRITYTSVQLCRLSKIWTRTLHNRLDAQCNTVGSDLDRSHLVSRGVAPDALILRESARHSLVQSRRSRHAPSNPRGQGLALDILAHCLGIFESLASNLAIAEDTCGCLSRVG